MNTISKATEKTTHTIDATEQSIGRVASAAAKILVGKAAAGFTRNNVSPVTVTITNASRAKISEAKLNTKQYKRYSGYPDGLRSDTMAHVISKKGYSEIFRLAVYGMVPSNKLRSRIMKNLIVKE